MRADPDAILQRDAALDDDVDVDLDAGAAHEVAPDPSGLRVAQTDARSKRSRRPLAKETLLDRCELDERFDKPRRLRRPEGGRLDHDRIVGPLPCQHAI